MLRPSGYQRPNPGKFFDTAAKATAEFDKLIREKAKKGYVEVATNGKPAAPVATPAAASITTGTATGTTTELPDEDRIFWDTTLARRAWAVRGHPLPAGQPMPSSDALAQELTKSWRASQIRHQLPAYLAKDNISLSEATEIYVHCYALTIDLEAVRHGVPFALAVIANAGQPPHSGHGYGRLRTLIAALPEDEYREAAAEADRLSQGALTSIVATLCFLFPTEPGAIAWVAANPVAVTTTLPMLPGPPPPARFPPGRYSTRTTRQPRMRSPSCTASDSRRSRHYSPPTARTLTTCGNAPSCSPASDATRPSPNWSRTSTTETSRVRSATRAHSNPPERCACWPP